MVPTGYEAGALFVTDATPQLSVVTGEPSEIPVAKHEPASATALTTAGHVITGFSLSETVTF